MAREVGIRFYRSMIEHCKVRVSFYNKIRQQWQERLATSASPSGSGF